MTEKPKKNTIQNFSPYVLLEERQALLFSLDENILTKSELNAKFEELVKTMHK